VPFLMQAVKQGLQDVGARSLEEVHQLLEDGELRMEVPLSSHLVSSLLFFAPQPFVTKGAFHFQSAGVFS